MRRGRKAAGLNRPRRTSYRSLYSLDMLGLFNYHTINEVQKKCQCIIKKLCPHHPSWKEDKHREKICEYARIWVAILVIGRVSSLFNISVANAALLMQTSSDGSSAIYDNTLNGYRFRDLGSSLGLTVM